MIVWLTIVGVAFAAAAGVLLYRCGVEDGIRLCRKAARNAPKPTAKHGGEIDLAEQRRQWQEMVNFMQYDGSEMPKASGGDGQ